MTRPRSTYQYGPQTVASSDGAFRFEHALDGERTLALFREGALCWRLGAGPISPKQLFVADDGRSAVLDSADRLTFRSHDGSVLGARSALELAGDAAPGATKGSPTPTAGPSWDDYLAASFLPFDGSTFFVVSGRGAPPFAIDPSTGAPAQLSLEQLQRALCARAPQVLQAAVEALKPQRTREMFHGEPWRMAAAGWARVAGETNAQAAVCALELLANLDLVATASTSLLCYPRPRDRIRVNHYALDCVRQATCVALLRMGHVAPPRAVLQLSSREGWFRTSWTEFPVPADRTKALSKIPVGVSPSALVDLVGPPTLIELAKSRIVWSYDYLAPEGPRSVAVHWGRTGAQEVTAPVPIPAPSLLGRVA